MVLTNPDVTEIQQLIKRQQAQSVQRLPDASTGQAPIQFGGFYERGPLLPAYGTREREKVLLSYYRHDYNTLFRGAISGLIKRVQSLPWEVKSTTTDIQGFQRVLNESDFGRGFESFLSKLITDYSRYDAGAYIELIGPSENNNAALPLTGAITGLAVLDSLRCYPTGDPIYPVVYFDAYGELHIMHVSRVVRFVDGPETDEYHFGYGDCALSRAVAAVHRQILIGRYIEQFLDDQPPPGVAVFQNISDERLQNAIMRMDQDRQLDNGGVWGRTIKLFGLHTDTQPDVRFIPYTTAPEKFDFEKFTQIDVHEMALAIGLDVQDMWELQSGNMGTATQSEVLAQKSKGKALGRILQGLERVINQAFPVDVEFEFKYADPDEDQQTADIASTWANIITILSGNLTPDEQRQLLANQVPAIQDVITDQEGRVRRLQDDPKSPEQLNAPPAKAPDDLPQQQVADDTTTVREISLTRNEFKNAFVEIVNFGREGVVSKAAIRLALRAELMDKGTAAYLDGLRDGGIQEPTLDDEGQQEIAVWRSKQVGFTRAFAEELFAKEFSDSDVNRRAELWVNMSINPLYYTGLGNANKQARFMWVFDPIKEHCVTCLKLNGQVHRMKDYTKTGLLPQSRKLVCGGWKCGCDLLPTTLPARGRFRSVRYVRREHVH